MLKRQVTTAVVGYTDSLLHRQSSMLTAEMLSVGANRFLWKSYH